ncbi:hypothetical protein M4I32_11375 [Microbacterium sp. LRZ72]|uniref:glycerophosphodiester phosphodiesterase n=1 Tax=Microbacterium sp. LRZ72 TaxID=2942481 RepID=UPI0029A3F9D7|nr:glycerophosphodiester phosphodiesterase family protein [Microbacterium sp. LRZ72]MDX2377400.1 hypothetical protein [Microbacterium sp. LRZ72]
MGNEEAYAVGHHPDDPEDAMPERRDSARRAFSALAVVGVLALTGLLVAFAGVSSQPVTAREFLGSPRDPGQAAFVAAHRGDSESAPENTLPAVAAAVEAGVEYVEVDAALTADGHVVLMHDATVDRTTNGTGRLNEMTLAEVGELDAGGWFSADFAGTPVPTLEQLLDLVAASDTRVLAELKGEWDAAGARAFTDTVEERGLERRVAAASFDARTLALIEAESTVLSRLAILSALPDDVADTARALGVRGIIVSGREILARPGAVDELNAHGIRVIVYTFNDDSSWQGAIDAGVEGIVTDTPAELSGWLARGDASP